MGPPQPLLPSSLALKVCGAVARGESAIEAGLPDGARGLPNRHTNSHSHQPRLKAVSPLTAANRKSVSLIIVRRSASNYGPTTNNRSATNHCAATISDRSAADYGGAADRPARSDAPSTTYTTRANNCTGFYSACNDKRSDKSQDYDRVLHALSLPADFREGFAFPNN
jgi:hypothetical protein